MIRKIRDFSCLILYCTLIYALSNQSKILAPSLVSYQDKFIHASAYAVMGLLSWRALSHFFQQRHYLFISSLVFCSLYGFSDEFHQSFVPGRHADILDWIADTLGAAVMIVFLNFRSKQSET